MSLRLITLRNFAALFRRASEKDDQSSSGNLLAFISGWQSSPQVARGDLQTILFLVQTTQSVLDYDEES